MRRVTIKPRRDWQQKAEAYGFRFHTMYGEPYWDESAYYQFSLQEVEQGIEDPTAELHQMCLAMVDKVVKDDELLRKFQIPQLHWQHIADSWHSKEDSLYSRLDLVYNGKGPAKLLENNADTPTSLYETGFWQWLWLEDMLQSGVVPSHSDQFNSLQEKLINRFVQLKKKYSNFDLHLSCYKDTIEDRGTIQYLQDCASQAGVKNYFINVDDIGLGENGAFTDLDDQIIDWLFKLYPWEFMQREEYAEHIQSSKCRMIEPIWKSLLANKAMLPMLWKMFPNHPNLLPAWFESDLHKIDVPRFVKKPLFSREGSNIEIIENGKVTDRADGPYGEEGFIYQAYVDMPKYNDSYMLIGSWLVDDQPAGMSIREDQSRITQDLSRFLPHIILD